MVCTNGRGYRTGWGSAILSIAAWAHFTGAGGQKLPKYNAAIAQGVFVKYTHLVLPLVSALALCLSACSPKEEPSATTVSTASGAASASPYEALATQGKGFTVGALMSANTVYVMFDPQCPHCGHLWQASVPLHKKINPEVGGNAPGT